MNPIHFMMLCLLLFLSAAGTARSHGVAGEIRTSSGLLVEARYDDGQPMSYAAVEVFFNKEKLPFQNGRTDQNGRFLFLPDKNGQWQVKVNDGMGHQLTVETDYVMDRQATDAGVEVTGGEKPSRASKGTRLLAGLAIIFFLSGWFFWWRGLKQSRSS